MKLDELLRSQRAIDTEKMEYTRLPAGAKRPCRNRHTAERGITYMKGTGRYRAFAHRPFYHFVGTYPDLGLAVSARDQAELLGMRRLHEAVPELLNEDAQDAVQIKRVNRNQFSVVYVVSGGAMSTDCESFDDCLTWLRDCRQQIRESNA
jgi:hypothetical protein